ncbi:MAG: 50S ribosomal protein L21 [Mogibacterium sp.]|nr:50S ribosomal protein L21 [Mogibacterium sp.]
MYAIIKTGGKQYRVQQGDEFKVEKLDAKVGEKVVFDEVVAVGGDKLIVGTPFVNGYVVNAEVLEQGKGDKVVIYKYKAKKDYRRKNGHRQPFTLVKITGIGEGKAPKASAPKKETAEKKPEKKDAAPKAEKKAAPKVSASMKKDELLAVAKDMGIKLDSKATKADILAAIEAK